MNNTLKNIAIKSEGAIKLSNGSIVVTTGEHTGRSPNAKFLVIDSITSSTVDWRNVQGMHKDVWKQYKQDFFDSESLKKDLYASSVSAGHENFSKLDIKVHCELAWHSLFSSNMFKPIEEKESYDFNLYYVPSFSSEPSVIISMEEKTILISGTQYAGEMKKSVFTILNHILPEEDVLPMHCSINLDKDGKDPCVFFGLSGTGKTTLSADVSRNLIGDDEHGWGESGVFNFENGCYAKVIDLDPENEPDIWAACHGESSILENVVIENGKVNFSDNSITENTRCSYPLKYISNSVPERSTSDQPKNVVLLTCDAFGVLPAVAKLDPEEAWKFFIIGYTSKVAGTEKGVDEPVATFSPCFGLPFMTRHPREYADMLKKLIEENNVDCWMLNTGWTGGPHGVGKRISLKSTRNLLAKIYDGTLRELDFFEHTYTGLSVPKISDIEQQLVRPEISWDSLENYQNASFKLLSNMKKALKQNQ